jgi:DNA-binding response OmpR family regulator
MRKILIVEDEEMLRESYRLILSTEPYEIHAASDGGEALQLCTKKEFDLVLLDLMMPRVDGLAFLEKLQHLDLPKTKVIVMSNLSSGEDLNQALSLGAYKSVVKADLSPRQLLAMVRYELQAN